MLCEGKRRYDSWSQASRHSKAINRQRKGRTGVYRCPDCRAFHVGGH